MIVQAQFCVLLNRGREARITVSARERAKIKSLIERKGETSLKSKLLIIVLALACWTCAAANDSATGNTASGSAASAVQTGRGTAEIDLGGKVSINYGRPSLGGRSEQDLLSRLQPGSEWRMGADSATLLMTDVPLKFGDKAVPKGSYILSAKLVAPEQWALVFKDEAGKSVVAEAPLKFQRAENSVEQMTINLEKAGDGGKFMLQWGKMTLSTDFQKG